MMLLCKYICMSFMEQMLSLSCPAYYGSAMSDNTNFGHYKSLSGLKRASHKMFYKCVQY